MDSLSEPEPESGDADPQASASEVGPTTEQFIAALLSGQPLDQLLPLDVVPPLDTSPGPTGPNPLAPFPSGKGVTRSNTRTDSPSPLCGRGARGEGPPDVLIDAEADPDAHLRDTDAFLAQRGIAPAGALCDYVEAVRSGHPHTYDELWRAMPGLAEVWDDCGLLVLDALTAVLGARPQRVDRGPRTGFAEWLDQQMRRHSFGIGDLARALGVCTGSVSAWRSGHREPVPSSLRQIASLFGVSPGEVISLTKWRGEV